ncbi:hypothetical protein C8J56DRAFT_911423 [Mycena floridula]|nr:hypothetical protein C8J56DRAFT_911423 [Mycena floridula]
MLSALCRRKLLQQSAVFRRHVGTETKPPTPPTEKLDDFRPPWVYMTTRLLSYTLIPSVAIYGVFFWDFGEHDHVFVPVRVWAAKQRALLFSLSSEEEELLNRSKLESSSKPEFEES